ncbi:hypothetical protein LTR78_010194 [Recurvomyces mirabilis]|uniref:Cutinase n=1 Tax=Recurvomyces mirabilis TaxID=574656 RepID=A0AAE0TMM8_9PEZI|nr:hypothetical protein LTR78_010194 [Recurvomyces mirabilis]KAK5149723.1 hypothetical protein LTS14_010721 [Recurvomyces mirabilis]
MHVSTFLATGAALTASAAALPAELDTRQNSCSAYTIINTRGTGEAQGPSSGFRTMNSKIQREVSGGTIYNTVYVAGASQNSAAGSRDIINQINTILGRNPNACIVLEGYSQGAAATTNALPDITGSAFNVVKAVFLIGNPLHQSGLGCNVDQNGGTTTRNVRGISAGLGGRIPENWVSKTLDVCNFGDGVCDTTNGRGINSAHLAYPRLSSVQDLGTDFVVGALQRGTAGGSTGGTPVPAQCPYKYLTYLCPYWEARQ